MKKMTYVEAIDFAIASIDNEEAAERLTALRTSLVNRANHKSEVASKKNEGKAEFAESIFNAMQSGVAYSTTDIQGLLPELDKASPQKIANYMKLLGERITTSKVKGKVVYTIA